MGRRCAGRSGPPGKASPGRVSRSARRRLHLGFHVTRGTVGHTMESCCNRRRAMISLALIPAVLAGQTDPASAPPQEGDLLAGVNDKSLGFLRPENIAIGAPPTRVWPVKHAGNIAR